MSFPPARVVLVAAAVLTACLLGAVLLAFLRAPSGVDLQARVASIRKAHDAPAMSIQQVAPLLREAIVATEDERFYRHRGVDLIALLRAVPYDLTHLSLAQGASTITEQLAKIAYLAGNDHSPSRKLTDIALGFRLGRRYSRESILSDYLSIAYFGGGQYGAKNAARYYFGRDARHLDLAQSSLLAGLVQAPSLFDPFRDPSAARDRQIAVLRAMVRNGYVTSADAAAALAHGLRLRGGATLAPVRNVSFAVPAPFDFAELAAAAVMLAAALGALATLRFAFPSFGGRPFVRLAAVVLVLAAALTAAHSVQTI